MLFGTGGVPTGLYAQASGLGVDSPKISRTMSYSGLFKASFMMDNGVISLAVITALRVCGVNPEINATSGVNGGRGIGVR